jgi:Protein of unknown function (DUF2516)
MLLGGLNSLFDLIGLAVLCLHVFALVDAAVRPAQAFPAADKQTKQFWLIILGVATAWQLFFWSRAFLGIIGIIGIIAVIVYLVDVRPAVRSLGRGGRSEGPYGPW